MVYTGLGVVSLFFTIMTELTLGLSLLYSSIIIVLAEQLVLKALFPV